MLVACADALHGNEGHGIHVRACSEPIIGVAEPKTDYARVVVVANHGHGILIEKTTSAKVVNTRVGTGHDDPSGGDLYNFQDLSGGGGEGGVYVSTSSNTSIGAPGVGGRVVVGYAGANGIRIESSSDTVITNTIAINNRDSGVMLAEYSYNTIVGTAGSINEPVLLLGNGGDGLTVSGTEVTVANTHTGVTPTSHDYSVECNKLHANGRSGIYIEHAAGVAIGASGGAAARVLSSCNGLHGVAVEYAAFDVSVANTFSTHNLLSGFHIGEGASTIQIGAAGRGNGVVSSSNNVYGIEVERGSTAVAIVNSIVGIGASQEKNPTGNKAGGILSRAVDVRIGTELPSLTASTCASDRQMCKCVGTVLWGRRQDAELAAHCLAQTLKKCALLLSASHLPDVSFDLRILPCSYRRFVSGKPGAGTLTSLAELRGTQYYAKKVNGEIYCSSFHKEKVEFNRDPTYGYYKHCMCVPDTVPETERTEGGSSSTSRKLSQTRYYTPCGKREVETLGTL